MVYLLIDFGASFIKTATYNKSTKLIEKSLHISSPFVKSTSIRIEEVRSIINEILDMYGEVDGIVACSILGGYYENGIYHSWKEGTHRRGDSCLISELFREENTFHIHQHHSKTVHADFYEKKLKVLGYVKNTPVYSILGDTDCAIASLSLTDRDTVVNIGTGSQVIHFDGRYSFIPAGRSLLVFEEFFNSIGLSVFELLQNITVEDVLGSSLVINLNNFKQSHKYEEGGSILNINEASFNISNLLGSILKEMVLQYATYLEKHPNNNIILTGGIPSKLPILVELFMHYYPERIITDKSNSTNTHTGMAFYIEKYL